MKIYFGASTTPVNGDSVYYVGRQETLFTDYFKLGSASACEYIFEFDKSLNYQGQTIRVYDDNDDLIATVEPMEIDESANNVTKVTAYDNMVKFDFQYDASALIGSPEQGEQDEDEVEGQNESTPVTLLEVLQDMCDKAGVELKTEHLYMSDGVTDLGTMMINWYDNTYTARQYIGMIAEMYGGYAFITAEGSLDFSLFSNAVVNIQVDDCSSFELGDRHEITRVYWGESHYYPLNYASGDDVLLDLNNMFLTDCVLQNNTALTMDDLIENIWDRIGGFYFYSVTVDDMPIPEIRAGKMVAFIDENNNRYPTFWNVKQEYNGQWVGGLESKFGSAKQGEMQAYNSAVQSIKSIKVLVDRANASLTILARETNGNSDELAKLQVTLNQIGLYVSGLSSEINGIVSSAIDVAMDNIMFEISQVQQTENEKWNKLSTWIRFDEHGISIGKIGDNASDIVGVFGNERLSFQTQGGQERAWLDADEGLGATRISVGNPDNQYASQRWQIITSESGDHLRFTRHS